jgi:hypothetical protein
MNSAHNRLWRPVLRYTREPVPCYPGGFRNVHITEVNRGQYDSS